ncbi:MAG TPA: hypothetical protein VF193_03380 [Steroidobacter sp.]
MSNVSMFRRVALAVVIACAALATFALTPVQNAIANPRSSADPNLQEIADYRLNIEVVRKWAKAAKGLKRLERDYPELGDADFSDSASLDDMAAFFDDIPEASDAIRKAGLDTREYVVVSFAIMQAAMAQWLMEQGTPREKIAAEMGIHPANLAFVEKHKAELEAINKEIAKIEKEMQEIEN